MDIFQRDMSGEPVNPEDDDYHKIFTHWILYPNIIGVLFNIFGESQLVAFVFNAMLKKIPLIS